AAPENAEIGSENRGAVDARAAVEAANVPPPAAAEPAPAAASEAEAPAAPADSEAEAKGMADAEAAIAEPTPVEAAPAEAAPVAAGYKPDTRLAAKSDTGEYPYLGVWAPNAEACDTVDQPGGDFTVITKVSLRQGTELTLVDAV